MAKLGPAKILGLFFGSLVVGIMLFMMFAILGGLFAANQQPV